jgi:hypothetical protein
MARKAIRFAVVHPETGKHGRGWKVWVHRDDVYLAAVDLGDRLKVSLHDDLWRVAFTAEHWRSGEVPNNAPGPGRNLWQIDRLPDVVDGVQHAWFIVVPSETLIHDEPLDPRLELIIAPVDGRAVNVNLWLCNQDVTRRPQHPVDPSPLVLSDGRSLWVGVDLGECEVDPGFDAGRVEGTMVEFSHPESPGDTPGFIMRTVAVDRGGA